MFYWNLVLLPCHYKLLLLTFLEYFSFSILTVQANKGKKKNPNSSNKKHTNQKKYNNNKKNQQQGELYNTIQVIHILKKNVLPSPFPSAPSLFHFSIKALPMWLHRQHRRCSVGKKQNHRTKIRFWTKDTCDSEVAQCRVELQLQYSNPVVKVF